MTVGAVTVEPVAVGRGEREFESVRVTPSTAQWKQSRSSAKAIGPEYSAAIFARVSGSCPNERNMR